MPLPHLTLRTNIWLETDDGEVALSRWRLTLLEAVDRTGSISAAAKAMDVQYRLAWQRIKEMEARLGISLVETTVGGIGGGGARLTPEAHKIVERLRAFFDKVDACIQEETVNQLHRLAEEID